MKNALIPPIITLFCAGLLACSAPDTGELNSDPSLDLSFDSVSEPVLFVSNDRREAGALTATELKWADATGALMPSAGLNCLPDGSCQLPTRPWTSLTADNSQPLCSTQPGYNQAKANGRCSAFLVSDTVAVTAGHCFNAEFTCANMKLAFGIYANSSGTNAPTSLPQGNVYGCAEILKDSDGSLGDWAVFRLDRPVVGRQPLKVAQGRRPSVGTAVVALGYPQSLPLKLSDNGKVVRSEGSVGETRFATDLDALPGNSGGPILRKDTGEVVGVLTDGPDFEGGEWEQTAAGCFQERTCSAAGCTVPSGIRWTLGTEVQRAAMTANLSMTCNATTECSSGYCKDGLCQMNKYPNTSCESALCKSGSCTLDNVSCLREFDMIGSARSKLDAVAAIFPTSAVTCSGEDCTLTTSTLDSARLNPGYPSRPLCADEPVRGQPKGAGGTAFLVGPNLVATAGHLVPDQQTCDTTRFVFGFAQDYRDTDGPAKVKGADVYRCSSVIQSQSGTNGAANWALLRLDRAVPSSGANSRNPLRLSPVIDTPSVNSFTSVMGYPLGLPLKYHLAGKVMSSGAVTPTEFALNNSIFRGAAGSPVLLNNDVVIGVVTDGPESSDYFTDVTSSGGLCMRLRRCDLASGCSAQKPFGIANSIKGLREAVATSAP